MRSAIYLEIMNISVSDVQAHSKSQQDEEVVNSALSFVRCESNSYL